MLIEIPVYVAFDVETTHSVSRQRAAGDRVITMRYDLTDNHAVAQFCLEYPPRPTSHWSVDKEGVLFALLTSKADAEINKRAAGDPKTYELARLQEPS